MLQQPALITQDNGYTAYITMPEKPSVNQSYNNTLTTCPYHEEGRAVSLKMHDNFDVVTIRLIKSIGDCKNECEEVECRLQVFLSVLVNPMKIPITIHTIAAHVPIKESGLLLRLHVFVNSEN